MTSEPTSAQCPRASRWMTAFLWWLQTQRSYRGSVTDPALLPLSSSCNSRLRMDEELIRIMTKAVNVLGLEWSPPDEPSRRLDEWFLPGCHQGSGYILANRLPTTSSNRQSKLWYTPITNTRWVTRKAQCYFLFSQHGTIERHKARGLRSKRRGTS